MPEPESCVEPRERSVRVAKPGMEDDKTEGGSLALGRKLLEFLEQRHGLVSAPEPGVDMPEERQ